MRSILHFVFYVLTLSTLSAQNIAHQNHELTSSTTNIPGVKIYQVATFNNAELGARGGGSYVMDLGRFGEVEFYAEPYDLMRFNYKSYDQDGEIPSAAIQTWKGYTDDGQVRLTFSDHFTHGFIETADETYWVEPKWYYDGAEEKTNEVVIYRASDVHFDDHRTCGATEANHRGQLLQQEAQRQSQARLGQCYEVELAVASDFSMFSKYNNNTMDVEAHNVAVINSVNTNYTGAFDDDIEFTIVEQWFSTCATCDPWTSNTDAQAVLSSFTNWGQNGGFSTNYDLGEMWTNRDFDGTTIGIAWVEVVCENFRYHCLQDFSSNAEFLRVVAAHEIGHNFSAVHAPQSNFIMSPSVSLTSSWHPNTVSDLSDYIAALANQGGCLSPCPSGDVSVPAFDIATNIICPGQQLTFYDQSTNSPFSWTWTFAGGSPAVSNDQHPTVTYNVPGTFPVTLEVTNGAGTSSQTFNGAVTVSSPGTSFPMYQDFESGLQGWAIENPDNGITWSLTNPAVNPSGNSALSINNFAYPIIGQRDAIISPIFSLAGYQTATLNIDYAYARAGNQTDSLIVYVSGDAGQSFQRAFAIGENGSGNFATTTPQNSAFNPQSYDDWCGSGSFGANCLQIDISNYLGSRDVIVKIENYTNSGNNLYLDKIYVSTDCFFLPPPEADFTGQPTEGCMPLVVQFTDQSSNSPHTWLWTFTNGSPASSNERNPEVVYSSSGVFPVSLTVTNESGTDVEIKTDFIHVIGNPVAGFSLNANGAQVDFTNLSVDAHTYMWDFGDQNTSMEEDPSHTYAEDGTYTVTLIASNDCGSSMFEATVTIGTPPVADYNVSGTEGCVPLQVQFVNNSSDNATAVRWIFEGGSPATSDMDDPSVTYSAPGTYDVTLIAINATGSDTIFMDDEIIVGASPMADFTSEWDGFLTVDFTYTGEAYDEIEWVMSDGAVYDVENPSHNFADPSANWAALCIVSNVCGADSAFYDIAEPTDSLFFVSSPTGGLCTGSTLSFSASGNQNDPSFAWTFEGGSPATSDSPNPEVSWDMNGTYEVTLTATQNGASMTTSWFVEIVDYPEAAFTVSGGFLENISLNADSYDWYLDGVYQSSSTDFTIAEWGTYNVMLIASNTCASDTLMELVQYSTTQGVQGTKNEMRIAPNPVIDELNLLFDLPIQGGNLLMLSGDGKQVMAAELPEESLTHYSLPIEVAAGVYLIEVRSGQHIFRSKVIILD